MSVMHGAEALAVAVVQCLLSGGPTCGGWPSARRHRSHVAPGAFPGLCLWCWRGHV